MIKIELLLVMAIKKEDNCKHILLLRMLNMLASS